MNDRTACGLRRIRPVGRGSRVRLLAPSSGGFSSEEVAAGVAELERLGFEPLVDTRVFDTQGYVAGSPSSRAQQLKDAWREPALDMVMAIRGGYGSVQLLPLLTPEDVGRGAPAAFVGYSDTTSLHIWLNCHVGVTSVHGPMIERRVAAGAGAYDAASLLGALSVQPIGPVESDTMEALKLGDATGPLFGGTISQILGSLGTPWAFDPPQGHVLLLDEVGERPYRLDRMIVQLIQSGLLARAAGVVVGQLPRCDEADGRYTAQATVADALAAFPGPVVFGCPTGHTTTPLVTVPLGAQVRVSAQARPTVIVEESIVVGSDR